MAQALDPGFAAMLDDLSAEPAVDITSAPLDQVRGAYRGQCAYLDQSPPDGLQVSTLQVQGGAGPIAARLYRPRLTAGPIAGLVYFHGGGFVLGDLDTHDGHCRRLAAQAGVVVLAVEYRLAPEHPFPAAHDDALAATGWMFEHAASLGVDPLRIAVGGDSAGGNLAASVALEFKDDPRRRPAFQMLLYPGVWPQTETASREAMDGPILTKTVLAWFEDQLGGRGHPLEHRLAVGSRDLLNAPPALVVTAGHDPLKDEGRDFAERLRAAGVSVRHVEYPGLVHDFFVMPDISPAVLEASVETAGHLAAALA